MSSYLNKLFRYELSFLKDVYPFLSVSSQRFSSFNVVFHPNQVNGVAQEKVILASADAVDSGDGSFVLTNRVND
jgi:hypothetical protein